MNRRAFVTGLGAVLAVRQILAAQRVTEPLGPSSPGGASTMATYHHHGHLNLMSPTL